MQSRSANTSTVIITAAPPNNIAIVISFDITHGMATTTTVLSDPQSTEARALLVMWHI